MLSRRTVGLGILASAALAAPPRRRRSKTIDLPPPWKTGGKPLARRCGRGTRRASSPTRAVPIGVLSNLLWSAYGINRPASADRTAPSWRHAIETDDLRGRGRWRLAL